MPKGLIPLIGGLGVAGTMVGISIPSAVTVIPKKNETHSYTGFVYNGKIYSTELKAKEALLTELKSVNHGIKTPSQDGSVEYSINGLDAPVTGLSETFSVGSHAPTATQIKNKYSFATPGQDVSINAKNTILSIKNSKLKYPGFTDYQDFKFSLQVIDSSPEDHIDHVNFGEYIENVAQAKISGERVYSPIDDKYYFMADVSDNGGLVTNTGDPLHFNCKKTNISLANKKTIFGEAFAPNTPNVAKFGISFFGPNNSHKGAGTAIYLFTSLDEDAIKSETVISTIDSKKYKYFFAPDNLYLSYHHMLLAYDIKAGDDRGTAAGVGKKYNLKDSFNNIVGAKTVSGSSVPTLQDSDVLITKTTNPVDAVMWDMNELNNSPTELVKITKKVSNMPLTYEDITSGSSTTHSPYLYSEEVLND